jgi:hypothetical protein
MVDCAAFAAINLFLCNVSGEAIGIEDCAALAAMVLILCNVSGEAIGIEDCAALAAMVLCLCTVFDWASPLGGVSEGTPHKTLSPQSSDKTPAVSA